MGALRSIMAAWVRSEVKNTRNIPSCGKWKKTNYSVCQDFHTASIVLGGAGKIFVEAQLSNYLTPKRAIENDFKRGLLVQKVLQFVRVPNSRIIPLRRNLAASLIG